MEEEEEENITQKQVTATFSARTEIKSTSVFSSTKRTATSLDEAVQDSKVSHLTTTQSIDSESSNSTNKDLKDIDQTTLMSRRYGEKSFSSKTSTFSRSGTSSSSQEDGEPELKVLAQKSMSSGQYLTAARVETARSMESLRTPKDSSPARASSSASTERLVKVHRQSFLTASERDVRETRPGHHPPTRRALSGEDMALRAQEEREIRISAERRRGLFASTERRTPQQLSLPPPERRLTILSPHSPMATPEFLNFSPPNSLRGRRKKGMVLPKLVLPRSDSDGSDFFFDRCLIE